MKPPVPYFGSKQTLAPWIVSMLPPHEHYVEPFAGSLAVLLAKPPSRMETVNDLDHSLVTFWRVLRNRPEELARACALTPHSRAEYENALIRLDAETDDLERARLVWVLLHQGRARRLDGYDGWKHAAAQRRVPAVIGNALDRIAPAAARLHAVTLECAPALDVISEYGARPEVLLYLDPPYLEDTRHPAARYGHEMRDPEGHRELARALHGCAAAVVLSGYPSPLYDGLYGGWDRVQCPAATGNGRPGARARTEVLWSNRPLGAQGVLNFEAGAA